MTTSATLSIFDGLYEVSVTGEDYERSDPTVGLQGGFTSFSLDSAFNTTTREDLSEAELKELDTRIAEDSHETERILDKLDDNYEPSEYYDD